MHHWENAPQPVRTQVNQLSAALSDLFGPDLIGLYLHGSMAMGCFNPAHSDLDLIAVIQGDLSQGNARELAGRFLELSGRPSALEFHLLSQVDLAEWRYPTPFHFHYSEGWRERYRQALAVGQLPPLPPADRDLAAHLTILHHRGVVLQGPPIAALFPPVPPRDYLAAIWGDICSVELEQEPVYGVLCLCRVLAYAADRQVTSKEEGGRWALARAGLSPEHRAVVAHALALYRGADLEPRFATEHLRSFGLCLHERIARLMN